MKSGPVSDHLKQFGPDGDFSHFTLEQSQAYCRNLALSHYENFVVGSCFLPKPLIPHFHALYAFCRWADDLGDETGGGNRSLELLNWWRSELLALYQGSPRHPVMKALEVTVKEFQIPQDPFLKLISAFEQDQSVHRYETFDQLLDYCSRSANPVGHLVLYLFRSHRPDTVTFADDICTGLQLVNFWQDVKRDADMGRIYIPQEDLLRFKCEPINSSSKSSDNFRNLMRFEVERARKFLERGRGLVNLLEPRFRPEINLFVQGGLLILRRIERIGYDVLHTRPTLSKWTTARLLITNWIAKLIKR